jgi:pimeloyl-ACP methyl ester carboxylesterase
VIPGTQEEARCGTYTVFENREAAAGRTIELNIMVLPARSAEPRPDPVFPLAGGPGQGATQTARRWANSWMRDERDIVLVDQRGTGMSNPLHCDMPGSDEDPQSYLQPVFSAKVFEPCRAKLEQVADLTQYTTPIAADDLNEVRDALGYDRINLVGGSYGTRAALVYMRRHTETVRAAILNGVAPIGFRNPLYHAYEAQRVLENTFRDCAEDPACHAAFPDLEQEFEELITNLEKEPATVSIPHPATGEDVTVSLSRYAFAEALRTTMYYLPAARDVPLLIHSAYEGDFDVFTRVGVASNRGIVDALQFGMLLSVTCPEDVARIAPEEIPELTGGTFLGDTRVRGQIEACSVWPKAEVPKDYGDPVSVATPTLVLSGTIDPVTSVRWGEKAARHVPNGLHIVAPGAHGVGGPCSQGIQRAFLERASVEGLDTACVADMTLPPFRVRGGEGM